MDLRHYDGDGRARFVTFGIHRQLPLLTNTPARNSVREKINYCHYNPVVRGLVKSPGDWIWSNYNWYQGNRNVPIKMDGIE
jgi:hypothetical protein